MNSLTKKKLLLKKIRNKQLTIGSWIQLNNSDVVEILSHSHYEWLVVDMEHSTIDINNLPELFRAIELGGSIPFVRLPQESEFLCPRVLDAGASGIIFPNIKNSKQINKSIERCMWPNKGSRGLGFSRANLYGLKLNEYRKNFLRPIIIAMIESVEGLNNLELILSNKNIDSIFIGPYDLSQSLGVAGDFRSQIFKNAVKKIFKICKKNNISVGIHITKTTKIELEKAIKNGFNFIAYGADIIFLRNNSTNPILLK